MYSVYNHPAAEYLESHSYAERLSESEISVVVEISKCHVQPKDILILLKLKDPKNALAIKKILMHDTSIRLLNRKSDCRCTTYYMILEYKYIA